MGARSARKQAFLKAHPICCFCGINPSTTEDHVPARVCFKDRVWPEGFVFPACESCNAREKDSELVVAFHIHALTENIQDFKNAWAGLKNNFPNTLPNPFMSLGTKAKALSDRGVTLPAHLIASAPIVKLSPEIHSYCHRFARKLAKALYYRTMARPVPPDFRIITHWTTSDQPGAHDMLKTVVSFMPALEVGNRINTNLGDQFYCRFNSSSDQDVVAFMISFSNRVFFTAIGARDGFGIQFDQFLTLPSWRETD